MELVLLNKICAVAENKAASVDLIFKDGCMYLWNQYVQLKCTSPFTAPDTEHPVEAKALLKRLIAFGSANVKFTLTDTHLSMRCEKGTAKVPFRTMFTLPEDWVELDGWKDSVELDSVVLSFIPDFREFFSTDDAAIEIKKHLWKFGKDAVVTDHTKLLKLENVFKGESKCLIQRKMLDILAILHTGMNDKESVSGTATILFSPEPEDDSDSVTTYTAVVYEDMQIVVSGVTAELPQNLPDTSIDYALVFDANSFKSVIGMASKIFGSVKHCRFDCTANKRCKMTMIDESGGETSFNTVLKEFPDDKESLVFGLNYGWLKYVAKLADVSADISIGVREQNKEPFLFTYESGMIQTMAAVFKL